MNFIVLITQSPYRFAFIFEVYVNIDERIAGKQDGPSLVIKGSPISQKCIFFNI